MCNSCKMGYDGRYGLYQPCGCNKPTIAPKHPPREE